MKHQKHVCFLTNLKEWQRMFCWFVLLWSFFITTLAFADVADDVREMALKDYAFIADDQTLDSLRKDSQSGNERAQYELARQYERIKMKLPDKNISDSEIFKLYEQSANGGYVPSQQILGMMYAKGRYVSKDMVSAYQWLLIAANRGDSLSKTMLLAFEPMMTPQEIDKAKRLAENFKK